MSDTVLKRLLTREPEAPALSPIEFLPGWLAYGPVIVQWVALSLRHFSISLPTAANPAITTGGLCGESKSAILDLVRGDERRWIAPYVTIATGVEDEPRATRAMASGGIGFPVVVKPDIGCNGTGVRLVRMASELAPVLSSFPRDVRLVLQALIPWEGEAGLFYIRHPDWPVGRITSVTLKTPPMVTGDGVATLRALIEADPRHGKLAHLYIDRLGDRLETVPARGEPVQLVFTGNHCKGSIFRDGRDEITQALCARIESIARAMPDFHFGRIDVRFASLAALRRGEAFSIIEINGVGSEATHIWDPSTTLREVWGAQFRHYGMAFRIGAAMRRRGARPSGGVAMLRDWRLQRRLLRSYPLND